MYTERDATDMTTQESEGLGDTVAKITEKLGIDKLAVEVSKAMGQEDCGCNKRRRRLNELFPYKK